MVNWNIMKKEIFAFFGLSRLLVLVQSRQTLQHRRMRMVPGRVQPVVDGESQIVDVQLDQRLAQLRRIAQPLGERIRFVLELARQRRHRERDDRIVAGQHIVADDQQSDEHRSGADREAERSVQRIVVEEPAENGKHQKQMDLHDDNVLGDVAHLPVAQLMGEYGQHLTVLAALATIVGRFLRFTNRNSLVHQQRIEQNDPLRAPQTIEVRIAVRRSLRSVHHIQLGERELEPTGQLLDGRAQRTVGQRTVLVEKRSNENRIDGEEEQRDETHECPQPDEEVRSANGHNVDHGAGNRQRQSIAHQPRLDLVLGEEAGRLLVESVALLHAEYADQRERHVLDGAVHRHEQQEHTADEHLVVGVQAQVLGGELDGLVPDERNETEIDFQRSNAHVQDGHLDHQESGLVQTVQAGAVERFLLHRAGQLGGHLLRGLVHFDLCGGGDSEPKGGGLGQINSRHKYCIKSSDFITNLPVAE